jgi:hypothetical protein
MSVCALSVRGAGARHLVQARSGRASGRSGAIDLSAVRRTSTPNGPARRAGYQLGRAPAYNDFCVEKPPVCERPLGRERRPRGRPSAPAPSRRANVGARGRRRSTTLNSGRSRCAADGRNVRRRAVDAYESGEATGRWPHYLSHGRSHDVKRSFLRGRAPGSAPRASARAAAARGREAGRGATGYSCRSPDVAEAPRAGGRPAGARKRTPARRPRPARTKAHVIAPRPNASYRRAGRASTPLRPRRPCELGRIREGAVRGPFLRGSAFSAGARAGWSCRGRGPPALGRLRRERPIAAGRSATSVGGAPRARSPRLVPAAPAVGLRRNVRATRGSKRTVPADGLTGLRRGWATARPPGAARDASRTAPLSGPCARSGASGRPNQGRRRARLRRGGGRTRGRARARPRRARRRRARRPRPGGRRGRAIRGRAAAYGRRAAGRSRQQSRPRTPDARRHYRLRGVLPTMGGTWLRRHARVIPTSTGRPNGASRRRAAPRTVER